MSNYTAFVFDRATGHILRRFNCTEEDAGFYDDNQTVLTDAVEAWQWSDETHWVVSEEVVPRPPMGLVVSKTEIVADGVDEAVITGVPAGALLQIEDRPEQVIEDGAVEFSTEVPGIYQLRFDAFPHRDAEVTVTAVPEP